MSADYFEHVNSDTSDYPMSPGWLYFQGLDAAHHEETLAKILADISAQYGAMDQAQYQNVIDGFQFGVEDIKQYHEDMKTEVWPQTAPF